VVARPALRRAERLQPVLDEDAGHLRVAPAGRSISIERSCLDGTLVLQTEHTTAAGRMQVLDALALEPGARGHEIGLHCPNALVRVREAIDADVEVEVEYRPRLEYGLAVPRLALVAAMTLAAPFARRLR
jgi:hypothetical protein